MKLASTLLVAAYLGAIVGANLAVSTWGPPAVPVCAFLLIGFDLVAKDVLQERWPGWRRILGLGAMISAGSGLSFLLAADPQVALASCLAFGSASTVDALVLASLHRRSHGVRVNASNLAGAILDSMVFAWVAFGGLDPVLVLAQVVAKTGGGLCWWWLLRRMGVFRAG